MRTTAPRNRNPAQAPQQQRCALRLRHAGDGEQAQQAVALYFGAGGEVQGLADQRGEVGNGSSGRSGRSGRSGDLGECKPSSRG